MMSVLFVVPHCAVLLRCVMGALRCAAVRCGALRCAAVRCGALRCAAVRRGAVRCAEMRAARLC
jgi:hypothetical protein